MLRLMHPNIVDDDERTTIDMLIRQGKHVDHSHLMKMLISCAEQKNSSNGDADAPAKSARITDVHAVTRPGSPVHWAIRRPPPRAVHHERIVIRDVYHLRRRFDHDRLRLMHDAILIAR